MDGCMESIALTTTTTTTTTTTNKNVPLNVSCSTTRHSSCNFIAGILVERRNKTSLHQQLQIVGCIALLYIARSTWRVALFRDGTFTTTGKFTQILTTNNLSSSQPLTRIVNLNQDNLCMFQSLTHYFTMIDVLEVLITKNVMENNDDDDVADDVGVVDGRKQLIDL
ncbi:hypothetical protein FF38_03368 [Lucilia cuprina]|uniref:Uncharacterized protein n=1 Tax=Lucilia cuprina TaxID=7375 RepID=A0A0L0C9A1_LUCCU|nr:hypothetical protein FF38_03368 [Lucilia cuprina]